MKSVVVGMVACVVLMGVAGCEWESSSGEHAWSDRFSWANFSGMYRGLDAPVVAGFSLAGSSSGGGDTQVVVNNESGGTASGFQTVLTGTLEKRPGIVPGTLTIVLEQTVASGSSGSVTDDGSGGLSGSVNLVGPDPSTAQPATGTINYDTGVWTLTLTSPGLLTDCNILVSYAYIPGSGGVAESSDSDGSPWSGIYSLRIDQTGQHLVLTDGVGGSYSGVITSMSTPGGDQDGFTSGTIDAPFEVEGTAAGGRPIRISGSLSAVYTAPEEGSGSGVLDVRTIEGIWFELSGSKQTADLRGYAGALTTAVLQRAAESGSTTSTTN
jgi:hypothetical protein